MPASPPHPPAPGAPPPPDRFEALFEHLSDALLIVDERGITDCNEAMVRMVKCRDRSEVLRLHPAVFSPERQPDGRLSAEKSEEMDRRARERGWHRFEWLHQATDGEPLPVEVTLNYLPLAGRATWIAIWHDLRERKRMEAALRSQAQALETANLRMRSDLEAAALVQRALLPPADLALPGVACAWQFRPCDELGGDLLNVAALGERHVAFWVLDVTGHGVAASLLSVAVSHALAPHGDVALSRPAGRARAAPVPTQAPAEPRLVAQRLNRQFAGRGASGQFFTLGYGLLELSTRRLSLVTAGHPGAILVAADGATRTLHAPALPLGIVPNAEFAQSETLLAPGERLILASDGLSEAQATTGGAGDAEPSLYGEQRLAGMARASRSLPLPAATAALVDDVLRFTAPGGPRDDVSLLALELA